MKLAFCFLLACSSRPAPPVPTDAGSECAACWAECGRADSRKAATFCSIECNRICQEAQ